MIKIVLMQLNKSIVERAIWENVKASSINEIVVSENWVQLTTPDAPHPVMNGVFRCELESDIAEAKILETISGYKNKGLPFRWKTCDSSKPANLNELLVKHGLALKDRLYGLIANPRSLQIEGATDVEVKELSPDMKSDWLQVQAEAWNVPPQGISFIDRNFRKEFELIEQGKSKAYIAYYQGRPVASAGLLLHKDYGYLVGAATAPAYRKKGVYRSLMKKRVDLLRALDVAAVIHCVWNTSAPICLKLGFEKVCEINSFELAQDSASTFRVR